MVTVAISQTSTNSRLVEVISKQTANSKPKVVLIKSHGKTVAELKVMSDATLEIKAQTPESRMFGVPGHLEGTGGFNIWISIDGKVPFTVKADEIEWDMQ